MSDDPLVTAPPHYTQGRFGDVECIEFTRLMMFNPGSAFKYVWRCEDRGTAVRDLEKALRFWGWAFDDFEAIAPPGNRQKLMDLYWRFLHGPALRGDWMADTLGKIIWQDWAEVPALINSRLHRLRRNEGKP